MNCIEKSFNFDWPTFWSFVQAIGVPLTLILTVWLPKKHLNDEQFRALLSYRNMYFYVTRWLPCYKFVISGTQSVEVFAGTLSPCLRIAQSISLDRIHPSKLSEHFAAIDVSASEVLRIITKEDFANRDKELIENNKIAQDALSKIDSYLKSRGCRESENKIMMPPPGSH